MGEEATVLKAALPPNTGALFTTRVKLWLIGAPMPLLTARVSG